MRLGQPFSARTPDLDHCLLMAGIPDFRVIDAAAKHDNDMHATRACREERCEIAPGDSACGNDDQDKRWPVALNVPLVCMPGPL